MIKTINLTGGVQEVKFAGKHTHFHVHSLGGEVLVSLAPNVERGADGVLIVQGGGAGYVQNDMASDTVYLVGSGEVQIVGSGNAFSPFKSGAEGGGNGSVISEGGTVTGTVDYPIIALNLYGKSAQDGTPTPDAPIDIVSVGDDGNVKITSRSNNLFDFNAWKSNISHAANVTYSLLDNGVSIKVSDQFYGDIGKINTAYYMNVTPGKKYTFSMNTVTNQGYAVIYGNNGSEVAKLYATGSRNHLTFDIASDVTQVRILLWFDNVSESNTFTNLQLEEGSVATAYVPYGNTATITSGLPLCSIGDVRDELVYNVDGTGKIIKRTAKIVFDGTNEKGVVMSFDETTGVIQWRSNFLTNMHINNGRVWGNGLCSHAEYNTVVSMAFSHFAPILDNNYRFLRFWFQNIGVQTNNELNAWLQSNPVTVIYQLETPQEIELSAAEMTLLMQLQTFDETTYIYNDEDAEMKVKIAANPLLSEYVKPVIDGITARYEARIAALEAAITNN